MAAFRNILSQARRHQCFAWTNQAYISPLLRHHLHSRLYSSSSPAEGTESSSPAPTEPQPDSNRRNPIPIVPVSYAVKQTDPENPPPEKEFPFQDWDSRPGQPPEKQSAPYSDNISDTLSWTPEDFRYVKDSPSLAPVSYPSRVAPLPEDWVPTELMKEDHEIKEEMGRNEELERERSRIEAGNMDMRRMLMVEEEKVPFPTLIRPENSKGKVIHDLKEAIQLVKANAKRNFEETFEAHVKLTPELRRTDLEVNPNLHWECLYLSGKEKENPRTVLNVINEKLSGSVLLPHGSGKKFRVAVFAEGDAAEEAREAGATQVGGLEFIEQIKNGKKFDFEKCFATHQMMKHVLKIAKRLKRGLMPNPENGTVTNDIGRAVKAAVSQTVLFQKDKTAIVHVPLGKVNYSDEALRENIGAFMNALLLAKPVGLKKSSKYAGYVSTFHVCSSIRLSEPLQYLFNRKKVEPGIKPMHQNGNESQVLPFPMGPSFPVTVQSLSMAVDRYNRLRLQV